MPRYTYECTKCGHIYEKLEGWDAKPRQRCPECKAVSQRIPAAPAIVFKGSGWYSTDNRKSTWKSRGDEDRSDGSGDGDGASAAPSSKSKKDSSESTAAAAD